MKEEPEFEMEINGVIKDALTRQANEAIIIQKLSPSETLNSKGEFNAAPIARVIVGRKRKKNQNQGKAPENFSITF